jgi:hypothetical protein
MYSQPCSKSQAGKKLLDADFDDLLGEDTISLPVLEQYFAMYQQGRITNHFANENPIPLPTKLFV